MRVSKWLGIVWVVVLLGLGACAGDSPRSRDLIRDTMNAATPAEQITAFESEILRAKQNRVPRLSPTHFQKAEAQLVEAMRLQSRGADGEQIVGQVLSGRQHLDAANRAATTSATLLADVIRAQEDAYQAIDSAKKVGATGLAPIEKEITGTDKDFAKLTKAVESDDAEWAEHHKADVIKDYRESETRAVKKWALDAGRNVIDTAIAEGAKKYAPQSLVVAEQRYTEAERFITGNPQERDQIRRHGKTVLFYANRLVNLTKQGKAFSQKNPEEIALWVENRISGIGSLVTEDTRDKQFDDQVKVIRSSIEELKSNRKGLADETQKLRSVVQKTQPHAELNERYEKVRSLFDPSEAEVLREQKSPLGPTCDAGATGATGRGICETGPVGPTTWPSLGSTTTLPGGTCPTGNPP